MIKLIKHIKFSDLTTQFTFGANVIDLEQFFGPVIQFPIYLCSKTSILGLSFINFQYLLNQLKSSNEVTQGKVVLELPIIPYFLRNIMRYIIEDKYEIPKQNTPSLTVLLSLSNVSPEGNCKFKRNQIVMKKMLIQPSKRFIDLLVDKTVQIDEAVESK